MSFKGNDINSSDRHDLGASEAFLWDAFRNGNKEAFEVVYKRYSNSMYNFGMHLFMDKPLVEDSIQDVFVDIWNRRQFLSDTRSIKFYLLKALKHKALRKLMAENKNELQFLTDGFPILSEESTEMKLVGEQSASEMAEIINQAVNNYRSGIER